MSALAKVGYFLRAAASGMRHAPFLHAIAVATIALALFTAGLARGTARVVEELLASLGGQVQVTVYVERELGPEPVAALEQRLEQVSGGQATLVRPQEALERLERELGDLGEALAHLPENPLPPSLELEVPQVRRSPQALRELAVELRKLPGVTGVDYGEEAVQRLSAMASALRVGGLVGLGVVLLTTVVIVAATLQLAIYARRDEIEIQKLVGATDRFVKAPFLLEGLMQGLLGAGVALGALGAFGALVGPHLAELFSFLLPPGGQVGRLVDGELVLELVAGGCALGLGGSFIAVGRFLRV